MQIATNFAKGSIPGWILLAGLIGYTWFIHQGIGPARPRGNWYNPTGFLHQWQVAAPVIRSGASAALAFCLPALLLALAICALGRSAVALAVAISCVIAVALFTYYGVEAPFVWNQRSGTCASHHQNRGSGRSTGHT